ncbi:PilZ domain-containing protein [Ramlibacter ginsenosidimutans]|uniref:PilZ domain-containing protein n=1 Tax=Ramlibacter ginsenosidimutans TaxID=502333 RepID=A0A934TSN4_9BURK|nr:PilZ domain-containing protein [Ramlibacter ginsenosidimutans]MBK6006570.1 PilZ domain-containing protein [Ramlibacter ginsenosidimutans]
MANAIFSIPIRLKTREDRRYAERFEAAMPIRVDGQPGTTRDLSASGLSFHAKRPYAPGALLDVVIEYLLEGERYPLQCQAQVVRSVPDSTGFTIGARLLPHSEVTTVSLGEKRLPIGPALRSAH